VEHVPPGVGAEFHVCRSEPERLLDHPGTHRDTGAGIVLGERDVRRTDTQDERGVDLEVGVFGREVRLVDGDVEVFFLFGIDELDPALLHHVGKGHLAASDEFEIALGHQWFAVLDHDQGPTCSPAIGVDDDVVVERLVGDVDLDGDLTASAHLAHPPDQILGVVHEPDQGTVDEDT